MINSHDRLEVRSSSIDRRGCFAAEAMPAGAIFREYTGERISPEEAGRREAEPTRPGIYTLWLDIGDVIDGWLGGNETISLNHSCATNCFMEEVAARIFIGAAHTIAIGEELTIDDTCDPATPLEPCRCGAPVFREYLNAVAEPAGQHPAYESA